MTGVGTLVRLALRRDRILLPVWILLIPVVVTATASAIAELYADAGQRLALAATVAANPALRALTGPVYDAGSVGGLTAWRATTVAVVLVSVMSVLLVVRHTRAEEETGRAELVGSGVVGRHALTLAAVLVAVAADVMIAVLIAAGLTGLGLPVAGAVAFGLAVGATGWTFTGLAVLAAQVTSSARTATGLGSAALGLAFALRAMGDAASVDTLSWLSPFGWAQRVRAFAGEQWWVLLLYAGATLALVTAAALLARRRDLGAGLWAPRAGRVAAPPSFGSPAALAWRLHRGTLAGWTAGFAGVGLMLGSLAESVGDILDDNPQLGAVLRQLSTGRGALVDVFLSAEIGLLGLAAGGFAVQATLTMRAEEAAMRAEAVLATAVPRWRWTLSHLVWALAGTALIMGVAGLAEGLAHGVRVGDPVGEAARLTGAALVQVPAAWVLAGLAMLLVGAAPRLTAVAWAALVGCLILGQLGELLRLDERIRALSPYFHLPRVPGEDVAVAPLAWLAATAAVLALAGVTAFGRRDLG
ncbi:ABC transporter permease [Nonomuraea rhizosphaerae]|uniref:ABC transporter permease n=1 Tax=Nonomuraea rhizosphaerae TaxID=2665663 RepID=UPI001C5DDBC5|nr:ABC transporter permease [Nonomuraea rhizosphaerae]